MPGNFLPITDRAALHRRGISLMTCIEEAGNFLAGGASPGIHPSGYAFTSHGLSLRTKAVRECCKSRERSAWEPAPTVHFGEAAR
jgi:hypothetical protein